MKDHLNVKRIDFSLASKEEILKNSYGEVTSPVLPTTNSEDLYLDPNGLFSEEIFGINVTTSKEVADWVKNKQERRSRFAHINTLVPYINPLIGKTPGGLMHYILNCKNPTKIGEIIRYEAYLVVADIGSEIDRYLTSLDNKIASQLEIMRSEALPTDKNFYYVNKTIFDKKKTTILDINNIDYFKNNSIILIGAYAIIWFLSRFDLDFEIYYTIFSLDTISKAYKLKGGSSKLQDLKLLRTRYKILTNMKKKGLKFSDLTTNILPVMPAGEREAAAIKGNDRENMVNYPAINKTYSEIISLAQQIRDSGKYMDNIIDYAYENPGDDAWIKYVEIESTTFITNCSKMQDAIKRLYIKDICGELGQKSGVERDKVIAKRGDYTGNAVIIPNPKLKLDRIGIPIKILVDQLGKILDQSSNGKNFTELSKNETEGLRLFIDKYNGGGFNVVDSKSNLELDNQFELYSELKRVLKKFRVVSIRFPSLHQFNVNGFEIDIVSGSAIQVQPLVCAPYNADFDGDKMSIYMALLPESVKEIDEKLKPSRRMLGSDGSPHMVPSHEATLGLYYLTLDKKISDGSLGTKDNPKYFQSYLDLKREYKMDRIKEYEWVCVKYPKYKDSFYENNFIRSVTESKSEERLFKMDSHISEKLVNSNVSSVELVENKPKEFVKSTVGRLIFNEYIPQDLGYVNRKTDSCEPEINGLLSTIKEDGVTSNLVKEIVLKMIHTKPIEEVVYMLDSLKELGYEISTTSGFSMTVQDIKRYSGKDEIIDRTFKKVRDISDRGGSKEEIIAEWEKASDELSEKTLNSLPADNPVWMMSLCGARGNRNQMDQLMNMRSLMSDTEGNIIETPITNSFMDGMSVAESFICGYASRKGMYDRSNRTKETGDLTRVSVYGSEEQVTYTGDCGDTQGILVKPIYQMDETETGDLKRGKMLKPLSKSVIGKISLQDIKDENERLIVKKGKMITIDSAKVLDERYSEKGVWVRSPITCKAKHGVCCKCYGYASDKMRFSNIGDAVGIVAAQTLGERGTQLTMRTFHTGGSAKGDITKGFDAIKRLITNMKDKEKYNDPFIDISPEEIEYTADRVSKSILQYKKQLESGEMVSKVEFEDFGIARGAEYVKTVQELCKDLDLLYSENNIKILSIHFELISRVLMGKLIVVDSGDSNFDYLDVITWADLVNNNIMLVEKDLRPLVVKPEFNSIKEATMNNKGLMTAISFQDINKILSKASIIETEDNLTNPISGVMVSNPPPVSDNIEIYKKILEETDSNVKTRKEYLDSIGIDVGEEFNSKVEWNSKPGNTYLEEIEKSFSESVEINNLFEFENTNQEKEENENKSENLSSLFDFESFISEENTEKQKEINDTDKIDVNEEDIRISFDFEKFVE